MKNFMSLLFSIILFLSFVQAPVFALSLEDDIQSTNIASQYIDIFCEVVDLQLSDENTEKYINDALKKRSINFTQEDLSADNEFSQAVAQKVGTRMLTTCPLKVLKWMVEQKAIAAINEEN